MNPRLLFPLLAKFDHDEVTHSVLGRVPCVVKHCSLPGLDDLQGTKRVEEQHYYLKRWCLGLWICKMYVEAWDSPS